jgi:hypothetical protein
MLVVSLLKEINTSKLTLVHVMLLKINLMKDGNHQKSKKTHDNYDCANVYLTFIQLTLPPLLIHLCYVRL